MSGERTVQAGDVIEDLGDDYVAVGVVNPRSSIQTLDFVVAVPYADWEKNGFLRVSSALSNTEEYLRTAARVQNKYGIEILQQDWIVFRPEAPTVSVIDQSIRNVLRDRLQIRSRHYLDGYGAPHFVNTHVLVKDEQGRLEILVAGITNLGAASTEKVLPIREFMRQAKLERGAQATL